MTAENYIVIQGWMITELHLSGRELILYALIYGFSQGGNPGYNGSLKYLMEWLESTKKTVISALSSLVEKGLITKFEDTVNGVKFCRYVSNYTSGVKITPGGGVKITPNNKDIDNKYSLLKENSLTGVKEKVPLFPDASPELRAALQDFADMRKAMKAPLTQRACVLLRNNLEKLASDEETQIAILNQSIMNNWKSVYPLHEEDRQAKNNKPSTDDILKDFFERKARGDFDD